MHSRAGIYCCDLLASVITLRLPGDAWTVPPVPHRAAVLRLPVMLPRLGANVFALGGPPRSRCALRAPPNVQRAFPTSWFLRLIRVQMEGLVPSDLLT